MYRVVPEHRNHEGTITKDGQTCLETYLDTPNMKSRPSQDIVVLDYSTPRLDGIGVAKKGLEANKLFNIWRVFEVDKDDRIQIVCEYMNSGFCRQSKKKALPML